ncbi:MAG: acyl-[acyl-carrier-protein] thioesterase [Muribaculaceae bacterium]|nr:acyl-[acyl-carrier-protein] thioesterase [Muribaculaceae bacterium]
MTQHRQFSRCYILTAGESDAEGRMPLTLLTERLIENATEHANALGIGYADLLPLGIGWVLSRVSIEMTSWPRINESYTVTTWIESYNRRFSERNFEITGSDGHVYGYARTVWVAIDFNSRALADLSAFSSDRFPLENRECPIGRTPRIVTPGDDADCDMYTFRYRDLDFNRHVNTVRYIDLILNHWPLEHFDAKVVSRFDIHFHHECHFGDSVCLRVEPTDSGDVCDIIAPDGTRAVAARVIWRDCERR